MIDKKAQSIVTSSQQSLLRNLKITYSSKQSQLNKVSDSLNILRDEYGIYDIVNQGESLAAMEIKAPGSSAVKKQIDQYKKGLTKVTNLMSLQKELNEGIAEDAIQIQQIEAALNNISSSVHIIEDAYLPLEKSRPKRSLVVIGMMMLTGLLSCALVLIRHNLRNFEFA